MQNTKWAIDLRFKKRKNIKIREQIKDWKNIHAERVTVEKVFKKKKKKNQKMWSEKEKKNEKKKKNDGQYNTFYFYFRDFWVWDWRMLFVVLFCWNCIAEDFVAQFDITGSGTIV